ncbi:MAG: hypothetical protein ACI9EF_000108 [Pseudohongiellaceae bacterium]
MKRVCVYCGSNPGTDPIFAESARALGREILARGWGMVFGGGSVGLMGIVADTVLEGGGEVLGVIPRELKERELGHRGCTKLHVVESMHERKFLMASLADGFVALPGGVGTLEEITEALTWTQLGVHAKPCGLLNIAGYWNPLTEMFDRFVASGFMKPSHRELLQQGETPAEILDALAAWEPREHRPWN